jgi:hypothetical protein
MTIETRRPIAAAIEEVAAEGEALLRFLEPASTSSVEFGAG